MLSNSDDGPADYPSQNSIQAAVARTASRSLALYFSRPMRLFRPSKVNGWQILKNLALHEGKSLTPQYFLALVKLRGVGIVPKHFIPPMMVNATLGTVLWTSYGEANAMLEPYTLPHSLSNSFVSGAIAGACQAVVAAPAENVRLLLEHGVGAHSWSFAWREVFQPKSHRSKSAELREIRQIRHWFQEVGQMAGRGWEGWGWGCAKDSMGFAAFFVIFELSRRAGVIIRSKTKELVVDQLDRNSPAYRTQLPAIANGVTLVAGGVLAGLAYEAVCRPFDIARRIIHLDRVGNQETAFGILRRRVTEEGLGVLLKTNLLPHAPVAGGSKWHTLARTLARVGPWGIGFLVWEAYG